MLRFTTAGESHGQALVSILEGMPAGVPLSAADIDADLARRQQGYGRGRRMQIERDALEILSGVRAGETIASPIAMEIRNRDWKNWASVMAVGETAEETKSAEEVLRARAVTRPRPGHADLAGMLKYDRADARDILERASARETTARVAAGAVCRKLLSEIGSLSAVIWWSLAVSEPKPPISPTTSMPLLMFHRFARSTAQAERMIALIDEVKRECDTLGGVWKSCVGRSRRPWCPRFVGPEARHAIGAAMMSIRL